MKNLLCLILLFLTACISDPEPVNIGIAVGEPIPDFSVTLNTGTEVSTKSMKGKVIVIEFFNTGCRDCRNSLPVFQSLYDNFRENENVVIFAIAREENEDEIGEYWQTHDLTIPYSPQTDRKIYNLFATVGIPRIYIADRNGTITAIFSDEATPELSLLIKAVEQNL